MRFGLEGTSLCCYACGGMAAVPDGSLEDRPHWPVMGCPITPGCAGTLEPEALN